MHNGRPSAEIVDLIPTVAHQKHILSETAQDFFYLDLQLLPEIGIQSAEGLVQQQQFRLADQHSGQRGPLLLPPR